MKRALIAASLGVFELSVSTHAIAHAFLTTATPAVGSKVSASPKQVILNFTEGLEPAFSSVEIDGPSGSKVGAPVKISGRRMAIPIPSPLPPGAYHVIWRVTANDTHKTQGDFTFSVGQ